MIVTLAVSEIVSFRKQFSNIQFEFSVNKSTEFTCYEFFYNRLGTKNDENRLVREIHSAMNSAIRVTHSISKYI